ncbi:exopolyphosphatase [Candidatus Thiothrix sp. Deng01]|uniref:Exopolyphosphatase n=1 Tax=Candidatus Thiothrix phosphatis TaxID=3112415 RepID=A0ABU6CW87_9GAMM|nr:exopolyphosphatase [Candidatus Thiothrix sp. Deng01]MEB4590389.1 exopolyphosphatase [Candidatus Thiothrix sp. Deng01]
MTDGQAPYKLAAIDLGSNSFHMIVVQIDAFEQVNVLDRLHEAVRLGGGLDAKGHLNKEAQQRAIDCLRRFGERIRAFPSENVAAVGTNTLRQSKNAREFLHQAEAALGHPISVISGREEARLIYLGVAHSLATDQQGKRFVMDIGGGSTELIIGQGFEPLHLESLRMGCVSSSRAFFPDGKLGKSCWEKAITAAHLELRPIKASYRDIGWESATGASGSIRAVKRVIQQTGLAPYGITLEHMYRLREMMIDAGHVDKLKLAGLSDERKPVFAGGVAILIATFEALKIDRMYVSDGALREGLIYDRLERYQHEDIRDKTVRALQQRFQVNQKYAEAVRDTAHKLFNRCRDDWKLPCHLDQLLSWAADLHEVGLAISHSSYHKHGGYLLANADLPGFSTEEQRWLSVLVRTHRQKISPKLFELLNSEHYQNALYLSVLLRLAVLLHRSHKDAAPRIERMKLSKNRIELQFQDSGLKNKRPLLLADLEREQAFLKGVKFELAF